jgi:glutamine synthetase
MVNTVLCTMMADGFKAMADEIEGGKKPEEVVQSVLKEHFKAVFNGNGYDPEWPDKAQELGIWRIDSGVDAINALGGEKNVKLFGKPSHDTHSLTH